MILRQDIHAAWYSLRQAPGYACTVVLTLALSLAMLLLVCLLNYQVLLAPLPYPAASQLMVLSGQIQRQGQLEVDETFVMPALTGLYQTVLPQDGIGLRAIQGYGTVLLQQHAQKPLVTTSYVTADYDELLAIPLHLGRFFQPNEDLQQQQPVAVLSYQSWQQLYQGRADILSQSLLIQGQMFQIIGVTAKGFIEPKLMSADQAPTELWLPFDFNAVSAAQRQAWSASRTGYYLLASLPPAMQQTALETQWSDWLATQFRRENAALPQLQPFSHRLKMQSLQSKINADSPALSVLLLLAVLALVGITASNLSHLILARSSKLQPQLAIAAAVGASRSQLFGRILAEQLWLHLTALLLAILLAAALLPELRFYLIPYIARAAELTFAWPALLLVVGLTLLGALAFTALIQRQCDYRQLTASLQSAGKGSVFTLSSQRAATLLAIQAGMATLILIACVQIASQAIRHLQQPFGFATAQTYLVELQSDQRQASAAGEKLAQLYSIQQHWQQQAAVAKVSLSTASPLHRFGDDQWQTVVALDSAFSTPQRTAGALIDEHFIPLLQIPLLSGRQFSAADIRSAARLVLLNQTLAQQLFPQLPLTAIPGQRLFWLNSQQPQQPYQVIGVIADLTIAGSIEPGRLFVPQPDPQRTMLLLSIQPGHNISKAQLNQWLDEVQPEYAVSSMLSFTQARQQLLHNDLISAVTTVSLTLLVLLLALLGIYGMLSYQIQLRRHELGIRLAIGAAPLQLWQQLSRSQLLSVAAGAAIGLSLLLLQQWLLPIRQLLPELTANAVIMPIAMLCLLTLLSCSSVLWPILRQPPAVALRGR